MFDVSRSGYYAWKRRAPSKRQREDEKLSPLIRSAFDDNRRVYGSERLSKTLNNMGIRIGVGRTRRLMEINGLRPQPPKWKPWGITKPDKRGRYTADLLKGDFSSPAPNRVWATDISWVFTGEGVMYLAIIVDLFSRYIVGWALETYETAELVIKALSMAFGRRPIPAAMIIHSDKGGQFCDSEVRRMLQEHGILQSMNGHSGAWWDNAMVESVFATIKKEIVYKEDIITAPKAVAWSRIFDYIEVFYNRTRLHSSLDYMSPAEYEKRAEIP